MIHVNMRVNNIINSLKMTVQILFGQAHTENLKELLKLPGLNKKMKEFSGPLRSINTGLSQKMKEFSGPLKSINKNLREKKNGITDPNNSTMFKALAAKISTHHMAMTVA